MKATPIEQKETFGQQYLKGIQAESGVAPAKDIRQGILSEWDQNVFDVIRKTREIIPSRKFYICVTTKREYLAKNTIRNYFESKYDCPTPSFEQVVYRIPKDSDQPQQLWVIPNKEACTYLKVNGLQLPDNERQLLEYVLDFGTGKLDQLAQKENGEIIEKLDT